MRRAIPSGRRAGAVLFAAGAQAVIALLLVFSLGVARQALSPAETILFFPRPKPEPVVIDARQPPKPREAEASDAAMPAPPAAPVPTYALPDQSLSGAPSRETALIQGLARSPGTCRRQEGEDRGTCAGAIMPPDPRVVTLEEKQVKSAEIWQAESDRRNAPFALPGAAGGPLGVLLTAIGNPAAFSDPRAYSYVVPRAARRSGADQLARQRYQSPQTSLGGTSFENQVRRAGAAAAGHE